MNELLKLPKDYAILILLAATLAIMLVISIGFLLVGGLSAYLYLHNYPLSTIIMYAILSWIIYILILGGLLYFNKIRIKQKQDYLVHVVKTELMATMALRSLNVMLRKWQRKHEGT
jgi:hypothetical protein